MSGTFPGRIVLVEGDEVDVDLQIAAEKIRLATPFAEIGLWDRDSIHFERNSSGGYELSVADDVVTFYPTDVAAFAEAVDEMLDGAGSGLEASPDRPVSLVPSLLDDDTGDDWDEPEADEPVASEPDVDEEPAARFGPSSRERLAAAMTSFRDRQEASEAASSEEADAGAPEARTSSPGFVIPGDEGYTFPEHDGDVEEAPHHTINFAEDLEDDTVADQVLETSRSLRSARSLSLDKTKLKKVAIGVVAAAILAALAFAVPVVIDFFTGSDDAATQPTTPQATVPTAPDEMTPAITESTVAEPTVVAEPLAFDLVSDAFVERWNDVAARVSPNLRFRSSLPAGDFEVGFTSYIAMIGSFAGPGNGIDAYTVEIDPTGPSSSDQLGIQALGLAIAVADPSLEPNERGAVLAEMGLNVRDPQLGGLNGATTRNGVDYRLVFDTDAVVLRLTVSPQSP